LYDAHTMKVAAAILLSGVALFGNCVNAKDKETSKILNLSLPLAAKKYAPFISGQMNEEKKLEVRGFFESKEKKVNIDLDAHFEEPHRENKDQEVTSDGVGVGIKLGI